MADLHDLKPNPGSSGERKRVGRGPGSGTGKTAGRGQKGQKARSGGSIPARFEGGQMPLHRRIPKRGFNNPFGTEYQVVNLRDLDTLEEEEITPEVLAERGLIGTLRDPVKILGAGEITSARTVRAHAFSESARSGIEDAGGTVEILEGAGK